MLKFILAGILGGFFSGGISRLFLKKAMLFDNQRFFIIWGSLFFFRLLFFVLSVFLLRIYGLKPLLCFSFAFIITQEIFLLIPISSCKDSVCSYPFKNAESSYLSSVVSRKCSGTESPHTPHKK